jgi:uncharacterized protein (TIGR02246 family)
MIGIEELARRVDRLEARNAIAELVTAYAVACDEQDIDRLAALFTADACFDSRSKRMVANGRAEIVAMFRRTLATRGPSCHWTHDLVVHADPDDPDRATGVVYSHAETTPDAVVSLAAMRYQDEYVRSDGAWRFRRREISYLYYLPAEQYPSGLAQELRVHAGGTAYPADYPESLPTWQAFKQNPGGA